MTPRPILEGVRVYADTYAVTLDRAPIGRIKRKENTVQGWYSGGTKSRGHHTVITWETAGETFDTRDEAIEFLVRRAGGQS